MSSRDGQDMLRHLRAEPFRGHIRGLDLLPWTRGKRIYDEI